MNGIGLRQFSILILGLVMAAVGIVGLTGGGFTGDILTRTTLMGAILVAVATLSFHIGQTYGHSE
jgi:hypothetical protein